MDTEVAGVCEEGDDGYKGVAGDSLDRVVTGQCGVECVEGTMLGWLLVRSTGALFEFKAAESCSELASAWLVKVSSVEFLCSKSRVSVSAHSSNSSSESVSDASPSTIISISCAENITLASIIDCSIYKKINTMTSDHIQSPVFKANSVGL